MAASKYLMKRLMDHALGITEDTAPTTINAALFIAGVSGDELQNNNLENEVDHADYSRVDVTGNFDAVDPDSVTTQPTSTITFPTMPAVSIQAVAILEGENILFYALSPDPIELTAGEDFHINPSDFELVGV